MTIAKYRSTGVAVPQDGGRPVALVILCTLLFLTFLDNTIVSVGLGSVQADLHAGVLALQWIVGAYALTFASAMLAFGMVGDEFGRKKVMLAGGAVFCAGSVLCALAPGSGLLIAGRPRAWWPSATAWSTRLRLSPSRRAPTPARTGDRHQAERRRPRCSRGRRPGALAVL